LIFLGQSKLRNLRHLIVADPHYAHTPAVWPGPSEAGGATKSEGLSLWKLGMAGIKMQSAVNMPCRKLIVALAHIQTKADPVKVHGGMYPI